jgi:hypothetical protein
MQWVREDATPEQLSEDSVRCQQDAWREARMNIWYYRPISPIFVRDPRGGRFIVSPGASYYDPFGDPYMEEARLTQFCMRNKGYELVPAPKG